jgi:hypothetical protein
VAPQERHLFGSFPLAMETGNEFMSSFIVSSAWPQQRFPSPQPVIGLSSRSRVFEND